MDHINLQNVRTAMSGFISSVALDERIVETLRYNNGFLPEECELWDYKRGMGDDTLSIGKTLLQIVSFHNTYGGYILYGVEEEAKNSVFVPVGIVKESIDIKQIKQKLHTYTGNNINISYNEFEYKFGGTSFLFGLMHIPKRPKGDVPVFFGKNGPEYEKGKCIFLKDEAYIRIQDSCKAAKSKDEFQMLFGERINSYLSQTAGNPTIVQARPETIDHNLPDRNLICPMFVGRDAIIKELWRWLGDEFAYAKVLAGDGGKGKTSIAYEFAEEVCKTRPYEIQKVIWLTAKERRFIGSLDDYRTVTDTHFFDLETLLKALSDEVAILEMEVEGASINLMKKLLREALSELSCLIIIDDVDSTELDQQRLILETVTHLSNSKTRFLLTTRMNFTYTDNMCIQVGGLESEDYQEYVKSLLSTQNGLDLSSKEIRQLHTVTDGSPLFTESLLRLYRTGVPLPSAMKQWKGKAGSEVRKAALKREIEKLSAESRRVLLACSYLRDASGAELRQATGYESEKTSRFLLELQSLFLVTSPEIIKKEPRFKVSNNTARLVIENAASFVADPVALERIVAKVRSKETKSIDVPQVGAAINQAIALLREERIDDAMATTEVAMKEHGPNPDLLLMKARCLHKRAVLNPQSQTIDIARKAFENAYSHGVRKDPLYNLWFDCELMASHPNGCIEVANHALENPSQPKSHWFRERGSARIRQSQGFEQSLNIGDATDTMADASEDFANALGDAAPHEQSAIYELLYYANDEVWRLISQTSLDIPELRHGFNTVKKAIRHKDIRFENFDRILLVLEKVYAIYSEKDGLVESQRNFMDQLLRESEQLFKHFLTSRSPFEKREQLESRQREVTAQIESLLKW